MNKEEDFIMFRQSGSWHVLERAHDDLLKFIGGSRCSRSKKEQSRIEYLEETLNVSERLRDEIMQRETSLKHALEFFESQNRRPNEKNRDS
jgi:microcompartment protein CcmL/EutN